MKCDACDIEEAESERLWPWYSRGSRGLLSGSNFTVKLERLKKILKDKRGTVARTVRMIRLITLPVSRQTTVLTIHLLLFEFLLQDFVD